jgi:hypothetical protein
MTTRLTFLLTIPTTFLSFSSCMVRTVSDSGGEVLYSKPVHGSPWESEKRQLEEVSATEESLGM